MHRAGFVLTGGRSSRMGRDKALLPYRGTTLAAHVAEQIRLAAGSVSLIGPPELYGSLGLPVFPDLHPGEGPLGGILTALTASGADQNLVAACDMPFLDIEYLVSLLDFAESHPADCVVPRPFGHPPEPLCAVYSRSARAEIERMFAAGVRKVQTALESLRTVYHEVENLKTFSNMNTPDDWESHFGNRLNRR